MSDAARAALQSLPRLFAEGRHAELEQAARTLLRQHPRHAGLWKALGVALAAQGRAAEALQAKQQAVALQPQDAEARINLGNAWQAAGRLAEALDEFQAAVRLAPEAPGGWNALARAQAAAGDLPGWEASLRQVAALQPASGEAQNQLGIALRERHAMQEAAACFRRALELQPGVAAVANNLANTLSDLGRTAEAEQWYRQALAWDPALGEVWSNLGNRLKEDGRLREAQACYRESLRLRPAFAGAWTNLLLSMNHDARLPVQEAVEEARRFGAWLQAQAGRPLVQAGAPSGQAGAPLAQAGAPLAQAPSAMAAAAPRPLPAMATQRAGPLRVGFVSGDLGQHPVGYFLQAWLPHVDPRRLQLHGYPTLVREDALAKRLQGTFGHWRPLHAMNDAQAAAAIHADGIDVLLDLSGHTAHNRLGVFARRPAPVQASWLGYFATTGLPAMDWLLTDAASVPAGEEWHFTERVWRLPHRLCFAAPADAPAVAPAPLLVQGYATFGSFQNLGKVGDDVLAAWGRVLARMPTARLRLQNPQLGDASQRAALAQRLGRHGVAPERVAMHGKTSRGRYLAAHAEVDVLLDTFPYPGGTTTCEALWMGVPTVTLEGDRMLARQGRALLRSAGLGDWVAASVDAYVDLAVAAVADAQRLAALRAGMRDAVARSPLFDGRGFARDFMAAMEAIAGRA